MRNILLSLVVATVLVAGAVGGTLATWSDSETSYGNYIETGSLDLKVDFADDLPWGSGVPIIVNATHVTPCSWYGPYEVTLWNAGNCTSNASAYIHLKNLHCWNVPPKNNATGVSTGYPDPVIGPPATDYVPRPSLLKTEPELVAEYGGKVDCTMVPGIGPEGDDCSMGSNVKLAVTTNTNPPLPDGSNVLLNDYLGKLNCVEFYLFDLVPCQPRTIYIWVKLRQASEEEYDLDLIPDPYGVPGADYTLAQWNELDAKEQLEIYSKWLKFNDWPSNALQADRATFDLEFDLILWCDAG